MLALDYECLNSFSNMEVEVKFVFLPHKLHTSVLRLPKFILNQTSVRHTDLPCQTDFVEPGLWSNVGILGQWTNYFLCAPYRNGNCNQLVTWHKIHGYFFSFSRLSQELSLPLLMLEVSQDVINAITARKSLTQKARLPFLLII